MQCNFIDYMWSNFLCSSSPRDVHLGELVKTSQDTSASHAAENVGSGALHQGHESFVLEDLHAAIQRVLVLDGSSRGHHHPPPDGINRIGHESRANGNSPSEEEGKENASVLVSEEDGLEGVVHAEVHATVDEDTDGRDGEATVQALDTVGLEGLDVHVDETVELALTALALGVIGQPGPRVIERVDEEEGHGSGASSRGDVGGELLPLGSRLGGGEHGLHGVLEGEVQGLSGEVPQDVSEVTSPEGDDSLGLHDPGGTVDDALVGLVEATLLDHLVLVLDEQLHTLDGSGGCLGDTGSHAGQHKALEKSQFFIRHYDWVEV